MRKDEDSEEIEESTKTEHPNAVARFKSGSMGIFSEKRPHILTVKQEAIPIMDEVVISFLFHRQYVDREKRRRAAAHGGGS